MVAEGTYLNPFKTAMVVMNPIRKEIKEGDVPKIEPFIVKINEGEEHGLLKSKKAWTLQVKSFTVPMRVVNEKTDDSVFQKAIQAIAGKKSFLDLTAEQAQELVKVLRHPKMKEGPFDAMILHHRTGSLVCVGQYDTPNDPELVRVQKILQSITFEVKREDTKMVEMQKMFGTVSPMPIPKY